MEKYQPGEIVPMSGNYTAFDKNGKSGGLLFLEKGKRFPITQNKGSYYIFNKNKK